MPAMPTISLIRLQQSPAQYVTSTPKLLSRCAFAVNPNEYVKNPDTLIPLRFRKLTRPCKTLCHKGSYDIS
jgi:hypothetical protein